KAKGDKTAPDWAKADEAFARLRDAVARAAELRATFASLDQLVEAGSFASLLAAEELIADKADRFPNLADDTRTRDRLLAIYKKHLQSVKYTEADGKKLAAPPEETEPSLVFDPLVGGTSGTPRKGTPVVLALARGVLYWLDRDTGHVQWAERVGIDTTALPA